MSRGRQKISFEGLLQENVLGPFTVIRGIADLRDLTEVSVGMPSIRESATRWTFKEDFPKEKRLNHLLTTTVAWYFLNCSTIIN